MVRIVLLICLCLSVLISPAAAQEGTTPWPTDGWQTSSPEAQGMNSDILVTMVDTIADRQLPIHSVVVVRNGVVVLEAYQYPYSADDLHTVYSVTKSVTSVLTGIAVDQGLIRLDQPMLDFFPEYTPENLDEAKQAITVEHLLTMSGGFEWPGGMDEPLLGPMVEESTDWVQFMLDLPVTGEPGERFVYNSGGSNLLAALTAAAVGQPLIDFARVELFEPLGIDSVMWPVDPMGRNLGGFGLQLTPRDMAKIGYLYLNNGQWDGEQIVSADWVVASTTKQIGARGVADGYGYHWWVNVRGYYLAAGFGGQYILVYPPENLVVVFTSAAPGMRQPESFLLDVIIPSIQSSEPLPENPDGAAALDAAIAALAQPPAPEEVPPLPDTAAQISGRAYQFADNEIGWREMTLNFDEANPTAELLLDDDPPMLIRLDGVPAINDMGVAKSIFGISFDNILRVYSVNGEELMLAGGEWSDENRFEFRIDLKGTVNWYLVSMTFEGDAVQMSVRNGLSGNTVTLEGVAE